MSSSSAPTGAPSPHAPSSAHDGSSRPDASGSGTTTPSPSTSRTASATTSDTSVHDIEVRVAPGSRRTGVAVVLKLDDEDRVLYREEIEHRADISRRLTERKSYRRRRRSKKWYRPPRFNNRGRSEGWLPPTIESIVSNQEHRTLRLARRSGAPSAVLQTGKFDTQKLLNPGIKGKEYQRGPLYKTHLRAYAAERETTTAARTATRETGRTARRSTSTTSCPGAPAVRPTCGTSSGAADPATSGKPPDP